MTNIAHYIDHTLLRPDATESDIKKLCDEANEHGFASVCVAPTWVNLASSYYSTACTVIGFPHGNSSLNDKESQSDNAVMDGAKELDFVLNIGYVKSKKWPAISEEVKRMAEAARFNEVVSKYIVEVGYLTDEELFHVADILIKHKVDFIKTCTGYGPRNVTVEDIVKIKKHVGDRIKIKASGGIKTYEFSRQLIEAGADRLGCSNSINIIKESSDGRQGTELGANSGAY